MLEESLMYEDVQNVKLKPDTFKRVIKVLSEVEQLVLATSTGRQFTIPYFNWQTDIIDFLFQLLNGAFGTFPYDSMAYFCKTNTTSIQPTAQTIFDTFTDSWDSIKIGVRAI